MTEFTSLLTVRLLTDTAAPQLRLHADSFSFDPVYTTSDAGTSWLCDHTFIIDTPDSATCDRLRRPRKAIVTLHKSDGTTVNVGTETVPAMVIIAPSIQRSRLIMTCTMLSSPFG